MDVSITIVAFILTQSLTSGGEIQSCGDRCVYNSQYRIADCSYSGLTQIPTHLGCQRASFLDLSFNEITSVQNNSLQNFRHVINLDISSNSISEVQSLAVIGLNAVTNIDLSQNHITMLPSSVFYDVKDTIDQIHLERNEIAELAEGTFTNLTKLTALFLGHNQLTTLSPNLFRDLSALLRLHVNSNRLTHISDRLLEPLHHLKILDLSSNLILGVPSTLFELLPSCIETITLANNRLTFIPKPHFREPSMSPQTLDIRNNNVADATNISYFFGETEKLLLEGNPFRCDCSFDAVREWIQRDELSRTACTWTCVHPATMEAVLARDLTAADTQCPETTTVNTVVRSSPPDHVIRPVDQEDRSYPVMVDNEVLISPMPVDINITHHSFISVLNDWSVPLPIIVIVLVVLLLLVIVFLSTIVIGFAICLCQTNKRIENMTDAIINSEKTPKALKDIVGKLKIIGTPTSSKNGNNKSIAKEDEGMVKLNLLREFSAAEVNLPETKCQAHTEKENVEINITENHLHDKETTVGQSFSTKTPLSRKKDGVRQRTPLKDDGSDSPDKSKLKTVVTEVKEVTNKRIENMTDAIIKSQKTPKALKDIVGKLKIIGTPKSSKNENNSVVNADEGMVKLNLPNEFSASEVTLPETKCQVHAEKENVEINITENHLLDKETTLDQTFGTKSPLPGEKDGVRQRTLSKDDGSGSPDKSKLKTKVTDSTTSPNKLTGIPENGEAGNVIDHGEKENSDKMDVRRSTQSGGKGGARRKRTPQDQKRNQNKGNRVQNTRNKARRELDYPVNEQSPLINNESELRKKGALPDTAEKENKPESFPKSANKCTGNKAENMLTDITNQDKVGSKEKGPFELRNGPCQTSSNC